MRPPSILRSVFAVATVLVAAACSSTPGAPNVDPAPDPATAARDDATPRRLELLLGSARASVLDARLADAVRPLAPSYVGSLPTVTWELRGDDGAVLARGAAPDPRFARDESALVDEDAHAHAPAGWSSRVRGTVGTVAFETPNRTGTVVVSDARGEIARVRVEALRSDRVSEPLFSPSRDLVGSPEKIVDHGTSASLVNVLVVPEGYTRAELSKFHDDAATMVNALRNVRGYSELWHGFNLWRQDIASQDSGITDPKLSGVKHTAFDATFGDDVNVARRCVLPGDSVRAQAIANLRATVNATAADVTVILVNEDEYAGCALPDDKIIVMTRNTQATRVLAHELGHTPFLLADEYADGTCNPSNWDPGSGWYGVNVSNSLTRMSWKDMLTTTQLPTPSSAGGANVVGAFEGAGYCTNGVYRPQSACLMRALSGDWCKVCYRELLKFFAARGITPSTGGGDAGADSGSADGGSSDAGRSDAGAVDAGAADAGGTDAGPPAIAQVAVTNRTGSPLWVRCAGTVSASCTDWTYLYDGYRGTIKAPGGRLYVDNSTVGAVTVRFNWRAVTAPTASVSVYANATDPLRP